MYVGNKKEKVPLQNDQAQKTDQTDQLTNISSSSEDSFISVSSIEDIEKLTDNIDESDDEWIEILEKREGKAIEIRCTCPFKSLVGYLSNDNIVNIAYRYLEPALIEFKTVSQGQFV